MPTPLCLYSLEFNWEAASFLPVFITACTPVGISAPSHLQYPSTNHHSGGCVPPTLFAPYNTAADTFLRWFSEKRTLTILDLPPPPAPPPPPPSPPPYPDQSSTLDPPTHLVTLFRTLHTRISLFSEKDMKFELQDVERARALEERKIFRALFSLIIVGRVSTHAPLSPPRLHPPLK